MPSDRALSFADAAYPARLRALSQPPPVLHVRGVLEPLSPSVAIVGSRRASEDGLRIASRIAREIAARDVLVVSGGALGIDVAAHRGALEGGGRTIVVLPTSLDEPEPRENRATFERALVAGGAWVSENEGPAHRHHFATRNRIIAALADLVIVVEARARSGTRHTVTAGRRLGRPLAAVPWMVGDPRGAGFVEVIAHGGRAVASSRDVLSLLGLPLPRSSHGGKMSPSSSPESFGPGASLEARILAALADQSDTPEGLAIRVGTTVSELFVELTRLELEGRVVRVGARLERAG